MSRKAMWETVRMAWSMLSGRTDRDVRPGRPREPQSRPGAGEAGIAADGFAEEALPWLDAVYRFSLRLTHGDQDAAEDLAQETFLRAHRFWHTYSRGTNAKSWLFTICRNTFLHQKELVRNQRETPASELADARVEALGAASAFAAQSSDPEEEFFSKLIDDQVVNAIDALPDEFHDVSVEPARGQSVGAPRRVPPEPRSNDVGSQGRRYDPDPIPADRLRGFRGRYQHRRSADPAFRGGRVHHAGRAAGRC